MESKLINIKDIEARNRIEPPEVTAIRDHIKESFKKLRFEEGPHIYHLKTGKGKEITLPSVSSMTHRFQPYVDWDLKAENYGLKWGYDKEFVQRVWEENNVQATNNGTSTHLYGEAFMHFFMGHPEDIPDIIKPQYEKGYLIPYSIKQDGVLKFYRDLMTNDMIWPVMPEAQVYMGVNKDYDDIEQYAGTFDMLFTYKAKDGKWKLLLYDWKGLPLDTPILTTKGFKNMGELTLDDIVYDKDGNETKILHISNIHNNPCVRINFNDNYSIVCDTDHKWLVYSKRWNGDRVMTAKELMEYLDEIGDKAKTGYYAVRIKNNQPINNTSLMELPIDPYVFGVWLGDGHSKTGYITNMYDGIFDEIEKRGYKVGVNVNDGVHCGKAMTRCVFGLSTELKNIGVLGKKDIPDSFIVNSTYEQRLDILRGFMDTDGYYNRSRDRYCLSTTRINQVDFSIKLLTSLGIKPTVIKAKGKCNNCKHKKVFSKFDVCFSTDINPFLIRNVKVRKRKNSYIDYRIISSISPCDTLPTKCIEVDSHTHTYLADKMLLVTHNTNHELFKDYARTHSQMLLEPFSELYDEAYSYYILQLSCYSLCLMQLGYEIADRKLIWLKEDGEYEKISVPDYTDRVREALQKTNQQND